MVKSKAGSVEFSHLINSTNGRSMVDYLEEVIIHEDGQGWRNYRPSAMPGGVSLSGNDVTYRMEVI